MAHPAVHPNGSVFRLYVDQGGSLRLTFFEDAAKITLLESGFCGTGSGSPRRRDPPERLVFYGRRDHMVMIHGHRVELGGLESPLFGHSAIAEAAVVVVDGERFAFARPFKAQQQSELREHCAGRLPRYMVPSEVSVLPAHAAWLDRQN